MMCNTFHKIDLRIMKKKLVFRLKESILLEKGDEVKTCNFLKIISIFGAKFVNIILQFPINLKENDAL